MTRSEAPRLAGGAFALTVAALAAAAGFGVASHQLVDAFAFAPLLLAFAGVGAIVASHRPGNPIGWLFLAEGLAFAIAVATDSYATWATRSGVVPPGAQWADWLGAILGELGFLFPLAILLFPDGRLPSRRWRALAWLLVLAECLLVLAAATSGAALTAQGSVVPSPVRLLPGGLADSLVNVAQTALLPLSAAAAAGCVVRYRRSAAEERLQIKWFAYACLLTVVALLITAFVFNDPLYALLTLGPLIPISAGIAIMRYHLYDIDVVISKTIVYGSLAAFITAVYVVIVAGIGSLTSGSLAGQGSRPGLGLSILATAVVAVAFQPVRERVRRLANQLVYGKRATPYEALSEFARRAGGTYATEDLLPRMARILAEGTGADRADVWLRDGPQLRLGASWPPGAPGPTLAALGNGGVSVAGIALTGDGEPKIEGAARIVLVRHHEEVLGALSVSKRAGENLTPAEDKLISDLGAQAGLVLRNVGLSEQLFARLAELRASRMRIVAAQDDQRRRIERDIHDGAQQQLLGIVSKLTLAESLAGRDEEKERALIAQLKAQTRDALETLRELARGIYPPLLAEQGLAAAVGSQARKASMPAEVTADDVGRYPVQIETAIYFCCVEALQNAARYAEGSAVRLSLAESGGELSFAVHDDGPGFDPAIAAGSGLQNMSDRLAALGGSFEIDARPGSGTTLTGRIPVPAPMPGTGAVPDGQSGWPGEDKQAGDRHAR